ncbi:hypothetical protein KRMM14A1259_72790 [Krasilnikovia sp. MM14-A1259]
MTPMPPLEDPDRAEPATEWAPRVQWPRSDDSGLMNEWTGAPSEDEQWTRRMAYYLAGKVPGATGSVVRRSVTRTNWAPGD